MENPTKQTVTALIGIPNSGKTTLFQTLTGIGNQPVNYPGATVEYTVGRVKGHPEVTLVDTPGIYSLAPKTLEEKVTRGVLFSQLPDIEISKVVVVVDVTQLTRQLPLVRQIIESGFTTVVALTMVDILEEENLQLDILALKKKLGIEVIPIDFDKKKPFEELIRNLSVHTPPRHLIKPLEWSNTRQKKELEWSEEIVNQIVSLGKNPQGISPKALTEKWDRILLHSWLGPLFFCLIMATLFSSVFWLASPIMEWISRFFDGAAGAVVALAPGALWTDLLANGIIVSLGAVLVFLPQIFILFSAITLLEDSGYLARAATLIDRPLSRLGLNGRAFVPLLSGYACAIPAMLSARTISGKKERWITLFIIPLMTCSARLPVFALLLAFLFWGEPAWKPGVALAGIYLFSLILASFAAWVLNRFIKEKETAFFLLDLPLYRRPNIRVVFKSVLSKTFNYLEKAGPMIFLFAVTLWAATTFPNYQEQDHTERLRTSYAAGVGKALDPIMAPMGGDWRTGISIFSAFAAREVFVTTLAVVFHVAADKKTADTHSLLGTMREATHANGSLLFTPSSIAGLIVFFLIALQCMATVSIARKEFGNWNTPLLQLFLFNLIAYALAVITVQGLRELGIA